MPFLAAACGELLQRPRAHPQRFQATGPVHLLLHVGLGLAKDLWVVHLVVLLDLLRLLRLEHMQILLGDRLVEVGVLLPAEKSRWRLPVGLALGLVEVIDARTAKQPQAARKDPLTVLLRLLRRAVIVGVEVGVRLGWGVVAEDVLDALECREEVLLLRWTTVLLLCSWRCRIFFVSFVNHLVILIVA